ncbi:MAG: endonuclease/exonuclease/phosphatase family protein [Deltaproteobacteria bacterium]|nr:endonuclease/exonuclease/phosphatase family protein [Nannocystaceae bacterium]
MVRRRGWMLGAASCLTAACGGRLHEHLPSAVMPRAGLLRVMTLNLAHGRGRAPLQTFAMPASFFTDNLDMIARVIRRESPHVVALQEAELGSPWAGNFNHVRYLALRSGLPYFASTAHMNVPGRYRYGTALISRIPLDDQGGATFDAQHPRWRKGYTWARFAMPGAGPICLFSVHLDYRLHATRVAQAKELQTAMGVMDVPVLLAGDFNANGRAAIDPIDTLTRGGLDPACTWSPPPTNEKGTNTIDWVLTSRAFECRSLTTRDDPTTDHRAVIAELALPPRT